MRRWLSLAWLWLTDLFVDDDGKSYWDADSFAERLGIGGVGDLSDPGQASVEVFDEDLCRTCKCELPPGKIAGVPVGYCCVQCVPVSAKADPYWKRKLRWIRENMCKLWRSFGNIE